MVSSDTHRLHHCLELNDGVIGPSHEGPERADVIAAALEGDGYDLVSPMPVDPSLLRRVHTPGYVDFLASAWDRWTELESVGPAAMAFTWPARGESPRRPTDLLGQLGYHSFAADCSIVAGTWAAAHEAASIAQTAADRVLDGESWAYGLCRPPGHHATADQFGGYCYLNNAAVAAQRLRDRRFSRVAVLDIDYHHGNGTQSIFYDRSDVLTASIHADPQFEFPWFSGHADELGVGAGEGWNLNLPLPAGTALAEWHGALLTALERIEVSRVEAIVVALGVDTFVGDPLGTFELTTADYPVISARIADLGLPMVIVQEGGYADASLGANVAAFLRPLA